MEIKEIGADTAGYAYAFPIGSVPWVTSRSMLEWCDTPHRLVGNCLYAGEVWERPGGNVIIPDTLYFNNEGDATAFRLVWSDSIGAPVPFDP